MQQPFLKKNHHFDNRGRQTLKVFEYQSIRLGEQNNGVVFSAAHLEALAQFLDQQPHPYYQLIYQGVKFSHYVGAIQVGNLTIEILPKADKQPTPHPDVWQSVLIDMLKSCRLLKVETLSSAWLQLRTHSILELYFDLFLNEVEQLLRHGLLKAYHRKEGNVKALKGRLLFKQHIQQNLSHQERFYTSHETYDYHHLLNQIILQALYILKKIVISPKLYARLQRILTHFPNLTFSAISEKQFQKITFHRKTVRYQIALDIARLLIFNYSPDVKGGQYDLIALLFDMNLLFEEYIYQQLRRLSTSGVVVKRQETKPFWNRRYIRPDIVLSYQQKNYVLDTKWKVLTKVRPNMQDLKQLLIYCQYFEANQGLLIYPRVHDLENLKPIVYTKEETISCGVHFAKVIDENGRLNLNLGRDILDFLLGIRY